MSKPPGRWLALCAGLVVAGAPLRAPADEDEAEGFSHTPPRLALVEGEVSFWRPGMEDWTPARVNLALAAGDALLGGNGARLELQVGPRAFVHAGEATRLGLVRLDADALSLRLDAGTVSLELPGLAAGQHLEVGTPHATLRVEQAGSYRVEVDGEASRFTSRDGHASVTPTAGAPVALRTNEQLVVTGTDPPVSEAAPAPDAWDRWSFARTDEQLDPPSEQYVPAGIYGAADLDRHGTWRVVPSYGPVWLPRGVRAGWLPYSTGRWLSDPWYGWTWVDDAPWGWAPFHHGRWVWVSGYWAWCPGPIGVRPWYAPALVAFPRGSQAGPGFRSGPATVRWVALGWGEPLTPWWGPPRFRRNAHWAGWGGPRLANGIVVRHGMVYPAHGIQRYQNAGLRSALVEVGREGFGRWTGPSARRAPFGAALERVEPPQVRPGPPVRQPRVMPGPSGIPAQRGVPAGRGGLWGGRSGR
jgi:hypothetical protein